MSTISVVIGKIHRLLIVEHKFRETILTSPRTVRFRVQEVISFIHILEVILGGQTQIPLFFLTLSFTGEIQLYYRVRGGLSFSVVVIITNACIVLGL